MVNVAAPGQLPDFRPVAGSMRLRLDHQRGHATLNRLPIGRLGFGSDVEISDDAQGHLIIAATTQINGAVPSSSTARIVADLSPYVRHKPFKVEGAAGSVSVPYYELAGMDSLSIPSVLLNIALPGTGQIRLSGDASLSRLFLANLLSADIGANYRLGGRLETPPLRLEALAPQSGLRGTVRVHDGSIFINGDERSASSTLQLPAIEIDGERTIDGVTYHVTGTLSPRAKISNLLNLRKGFLFLPMQTHELGGNFTVTARNQKGDIVGGGTVDLTSNYTLSANASLSQARLHLALPRTKVTTRLTHAVHVGDIDLPAGSEVTIPLEGFAVNVDANVGALLRAHGGRHVH